MPRHRRLDFIIRKFKTYGTAANLPGCGRNSVRTAKKNLRVTARHLQDDMMKAGTSASVATIRRALNKQGLHGQTPRRTPLLTAKNIKSQLEYARRNLDKTTKFWEKVLRTDKTKLELRGTPWTGCQSIAGLTHRRTAQIIIK
uniref:Transposase Tc1-like domain-containing protein n=1 Tax=Monopterus albus TaxID=43700 RepID=A0A3Q3KH31_MONAL